MTYFPLIEPYTLPGSRFLPGYTEPDVGIEPPEWREPQEDPTNWIPYEPPVLVENPHPPSPFPDDWPRYDFPAPTFGPSPTIPYTPLNIPTGEIPGIPSIPRLPAFDWLAEAERLGKIEQVRGTIAKLQEGLGPIRSSLQSMLALSPEALESRYQAEIQTPAMRYFSEQTLPSLKRSFVGPGTYWSSMRAGAEQRAGERLSEALMGQRSRMIGEAQNRALSASNLAMQLEEQAFGGGMYPWETALKAAPMQVQARGQDLQRELAEAQNILTGRGQDYNRLLTMQGQDLQRALAEAQLGMQTRGQDLNYWATLENMRQRERELWGYLNPETYSPTGTPIDIPTEPDQPVPEERPPGWPWNRSYLGGAL